MGRQRVLDLEDVQIAPRNAACTIDARFGLLNTLDPVEAVVTNGKPSTASRQIVADAKQRVLCQTSCATIIEIGTIRAPPLEAAFGSIRLGRRPLLLDLRLDKPPASPMGPGPLDQQYRAATEDWQTRERTRSMQQRFQILSLDGGGLRGLFSAALLAAVEEDLQLTIADRFDLIAGTSTGGIIAIALGLGIRPREIVEFYLRHGPTIFRNRLRLKSLRRWLRTEYSAPPLESALRDIFGDRLLAESTKRLVIPAFNLGEDDVYVFRTPHAPNLRRDYRVAAWKIALATSSAPTYFPACRAVDGLRLVDGGLWANNPAVVALAESLGTLSVPLTSTRLLSIGTYAGVTTRSLTLDRGGMLRWTIDIADILMRAGSIAATNQARFLVGDERFLRIDPKVPRHEVVLDGVRSVRDVVARARHYSRSHMPRIEALFAQHTAAPFEPLYPAGGSVL